MSIDERVCKLMRDTITMDRLTTAEVAKLLGFSDQTIRELARTGHLSSITTRGQGRGKRRYFDRGEVEAFRSGGAEGAKAYRQPKGRKAGVK